MQRTQPGPCVRLTGTGSRILRVVVRKDGA